MSELLTSSHAIVLGGGLSQGEDGQTVLSPDSLQRANRTIGYYHDNSEDFTRKDSVIVCSGGATWLSGEAYSASEASLVADQLVAGGVPHRLIEKEEKSHDTLTNFLNSAGFFDLAELNEQSPLSVVTHAYHYRRANFLGHAALGVPMQNIETPGPKDARRTVQEAGLLAVSRIFLAGVEAGDRSAAQRRADAMERTVGFFKTPLRLVVK